jgi:hypothetical protein
MCGTSDNATEKMKRYRQRLRDNGLLPIQLGMPDIRNATFIKHREKELSSLHPSKDQDALAFIEQAADFDHWQ